MNKYLEKIAVVKHLVKARRRLMQMMAHGTHDFKQVEFENVAPILRSKKIDPGSWGTNGSGVYAGHKAPAHGYQPQGHVSRMIAFPGNAKHAVPHDKNHRFHYNKMPVQDSVIPHAVHLNNKSYVSLPGSGKYKNQGEKNMAHDMEAHIRSSRVRRMYDDHLQDEIKKRKLSDSHWDGDTKHNTGKEFTIFRHDQLKDIKHTMSKKDIRGGLKTAKGDNAYLAKEYLKDAIKARPNSYRRKDAKDMLEDTALNSLAESGGYRKFIKD